MYGKLISTVSVGSGGTTQIDITSIPNNYTDLVLLFSSDTGANVVFNNVTSAQYSRNFMRGNAGTGTIGVLKATGNTNFFAPFTYTGTSPEFVSAIMYIPNYAGSTNKSVTVDCVTEANRANALAQIWGGVWSNTSAINSISIVPIGGTLGQYTVVSLYGITKGTGGATVS